MAFNGNETIQKLVRLLVAPTVEPSQRAARIQTVERDVILPLRLLIIAIFGYFFFLSNWQEVPNSDREAAHKLIGWYFWLYVAANVIAGWAFIFKRQLSLRNIQWIVCSVGVLDVILMAGVTFIVDGFDSRLYWIFPVLILHNALAIPLALPQLLLNLLATIGFVAGGALDKILNTIAIVNGVPQTVEERTENAYERVLVLLIWAACCYGIQVLFEKQKRAEAEATEFAVRQERLRTAGRLAAEIAHKIKNPLGIITNAAFCLQRAVKDGETAVDDQIAIIREEVERADQILTELMGYSQLAEGRVERLDMAQESDDAIRQVFPPGAKYNINIIRRYANDLPAILMQRQHLASILVNLLQNAREALNGVGEIEIFTRYGENDSVIISIADNGPGISADKLDKIFEAYFTTRVKGTGLGLAIVKHNTEMYGGLVRVESEPGKGTRFILEFPARILMRLNPYT